MDDSQGVTQVLDRARKGDASAGESLLPLVYDELGALARAIFSAQGPGHTLQPTAVVHEAWLKLAGNLGGLRDRQHFLIVAGQAMRQVITDHARGRLTKKRGAGRRPVPLDAAPTPADRAARSQLAHSDLIDLDESLRLLARHNERHALVAELRIFSGLSIEETATALDISPRSVDSAWAMAKAWLQTRHATPA